MRSALVAAAAVAALGAAAPGASAAELTVEKRCYSEGDIIDVNGTGFTPGGNVRLDLERSTGTVLETTNDPVAEPDGAVRGGFETRSETGWFAGSQTRFDMTMRLTDLTNGTLTASTSFIFSRWNVGVNAPGGKIHPTRPARLLAVGFTTTIGKPLYAHWLRNGRRVHVRPLGTVRGPCGDLRKRLPRGFPFRPVRPGSYEVRFSPSRTNVKTGSIRHRATRVTRTIR